MKSAAHVGDHPIHPMLVPYPFAFLTSAIAFDLAGLATGDERLGQTANLLTKAGIVSALAAAVPGLVDYAQRVPAGEPRKTATLHMVSNLSALACFGAVAFMRGDRARPSNAVLALEAIGAGVLSLGGWLGGSLAYHHQIGVVPEERDDRWELTVRSHLLQDNAIPTRA